MRIPRIPPHLSKFILPFTLAYVTSLKDLFDLHVLALLFVNWVLWQGRRVLIAFRVDTRNWVATLKHMHEVLGWEWELHIIFAFKHFCIALHCIFLGRVGLGELHCQKLNWVEWQPVSYSSHRLLFLVWLLLCFDCGEFMVLGLWLVNMDACLRGITLIDWFLKIEGVRLLMFLFACLRTSKGLAWGNLISGIYICFSPLFCMRFWSELGS